LEVDSLDVEPSVGNLADIPLGRIDALVRFDTVADIGLDLDAKHRFLRARAGSGERSGGTGKEAAAGQERMGHLGERILRGHERCSRIWAYLLRWAKTGGTPNFMAPFQRRILRDNEPMAGDASAALP